MDPIRTIYSPMTRSQEKVMKTNNIICGITLLATVSTLNAATFTVTNAANSGTGTLRAAIASANEAGAGTHTIAFNLASPYIISPADLLPPITNSIFINGVTQPGYTGVPIIKVIGPAGITTAGLDFQCRGGGVQGLYISGFTNGSGVVLGGVSNRISGCYVYSNYYGVLTDFDSTNATIGGLAATNRNVISGNVLYGLFLAGFGSHVVQGNYIGLAPDGKYIVSNRAHGIFSFSPRCKIGGSTASARNIISGNALAGIYITGSAGTEVSGNYIGLDVTGTNAAPNSSVGVMLYGAVSNVIGGATSSHGNYISGNKDSGVFVQNDTEGFCTIQYNVIGLGIDGLPVPNTVTATNVAVINDGGVELRSGRNFVLLNIISGNNCNGLYILGTNTVGNIVAGNLIGVDSTGTQMRRNRGFGVLLADRAKGNLISGDLFRNIISGNEQYGIRISDGSTSNTIVSNYIGTDLTGKFSISNHMGGILIEESTNAIIRGNLISGNSFSGITIASAKSTDTVIDSNAIGLDSSQTNALPNTGYGIQVYGGSGHRLGKGGRNVISGNIYGGVLISGPVSNLLFQGNYVGVASNGTRAVGNSSGVLVYNAQGDGIVISNNVVSGNHGDGLSLLNCMMTNVSVGGNIIGMSASGFTTVSNNGNGILMIRFGNVQIGGNSASSRNVISGNNHHGIELLGCGTNGSVVIAGNYIGLDGTGMNGPGNANAGIYGNLSKNIQVGGPDSSWRNYICGNNEEGIINSNNGNHWWIANNNVGVEITGFTVRSNKSAGIGLYDNCYSNVVENNYIAGNGGPGIALVLNVRLTTIRANRIGLGESSLIPMPNGFGGILVADSEDNLIGGYTTNDANLIAHNIGSGVALQENNPGVSVRNRILGNLIYSNSVLAIDLGNDGETLNDGAPDADTGPNGLQNFPVILYASSSATNINGRMIGSNEAYRLEFFALTPSSGAVFIGTANTYIPSTGTGTFSCVFNKNIPAGSKIVATATSGDGTSEFCPAVSTSALVDTDHDGMPNWWEIANGLNAGVSNAVSDDADSDGVPDINEWISDTIANDSDSCLSIVSLSTGASCVAYVPSSGNRLYSLETSPSPSSGSWQLLQNNIPGTGNLLGLVDVAPISQRVYRVGVKLP